MRDFQENRAVNVPKKVLLGVVAVIALFVLMFVLGGILEDCDKSKNYVVKYNQIVYV